MEIEFCDLCNESVPLSDFAKGRAVRRSGRVVCAQCDAAMGGGSAPSGASGLGGGAGTATLVDPKVAAPARPAPSVAVAPQPGPAPVQPIRGRSRAGAFGAVTGLFALGGVAVLGSLLPDRIDGVEGALASAEVELGRRIDDLPGARDAALAPLTAELARIETAARAGDEAARGEALDVIAQLAERLDAAAAREAALLGSIESLRTQLDAARTEVKAQRESLDAQIENIENIAEYHGDRIVQLEERIREAGALVAAGVAPAAPAAAADAAPRWAEFLPDLENPDAALRLDAVSHLAETKDPGVVPHILPLLSDSDLFVRMVVALALGDLDAKVGVSALIDRLEDESVTVREAAMISLRSITGRSFGFEPDAREVERRRKIDDWRDWWRKSGDDFLTS
ncbi:MAG: HEAT repeat domain-containing protein [Planctomycetota bacterium]